MKFSEMLKELRTNYKKNFYKVFKPDASDRVRDRSYYSSFSSAGYYAPAKKQQFLTLLSTLLGLPNHLYRTGDKLTLGRLARNFTNLQANKTTGRNIINLMLFIPVVLLNLSLMLATLGQHALQFFTEFLPLAIADTFSFFARVFFELPEKINEAQGSFKNSSAFVRIPIIVSALFLIALSYVAAWTCLGIKTAFNSLVYSVGRAISSPIDSVRAAWYYFEPKKSAYELEVPDRSFAHKFFTWVGTLLLVSLSILTTATMYTLILAPLLPLMGVNATLLSAKLAPGFVSFLSSVGSQFILPILGHLSFSPVIAGLTAFTGLVVSIAGPIAYRFMNAVKYSWETTCEKDAVKPAVKRLYVSRDSNELRLDDSDPILDKDFNSKTATPSNIGFYARRDSTNENQRNDATARPTGKRASR